MKKLSFFYSPEGRLASFSGLLTLAVGMAGTGVLSSMFESVCSNLVMELVAQLNQTIKIQHAHIELEVDVGHRNESVSIDSIHFTPPASWPDTVATSNVPAFCFSIPMVVGSLLSLSIALALVSLILAASIRAQKEKEKPYVFNFDDHDSWRPILD